MLKSSWRSIIAKVALVIGFALAIVVCDHVTSISLLNGLSKERATAHLILVDQLERLRFPHESGQVNLCVALPPSSVAGLTDVELVSDLRAEVPPSLNAKLIPITDCVEGDNGGYSFPTGETAQVLLSMPSPVSEPDRWIGGIACGGLCGYGDGYLAFYWWEFAIVVRSGSWIS